MKSIWFIALLSCLFLTPSVQAKDEKSSKPTVTASGLQYYDYATGKGDIAKAGDVVAVHYSGWLFEKGKKGKLFDSSYARKKPFSFPLGAGRVIKGWDEGVAGMKVGGKRTLVIPANLGYGARGAGKTIPPNANLMFDVELLAVKKNPAKKK